MKKISNYQKFIKKILGIFFVGILCILNTINVYASTLTIENVSTQFNQSDVVKVLNELGSTLTSTINTTNKTLDIYEENEKIFSFTYGDDYIEYNNRSATVTEENCDDDFFNIFLLAGIMESILKLSGYEDKTLSEDATYTDTYDTYGIQLETESYSFSGTDEDGSTWSTSGDYIKYFKMSLDTDKIDALIAKYGVDVEEQDPNKELIANLTPTIEAKDITENSITIYPKVNYFNTDSDNSINCYVYRSDSENGTYEKISDWAVNCLDSVGIVDKDLKSNTTYYYKTIVDGGTNYSEILTVTTKASTINNNINESIEQPTRGENIEENPKTGNTLSIITIMLLSITCIVTILYIKNKYIYNQL